MDIEEQAPDGGAEVVLRRWASTGRICMQGGVLAVVLMSLLPFVLDGNGLGYPDEGVYAAQVQSLANGHWFETRPAVGLRGTGFANGLGPEVIVGDRYAGYVRHSIYMRLLVPFWRIGGYAALLVPSVAGGVASAIAVALLARRLDRRLAAPALWLVAIGSPLLYDSYLVAAHTLCAAAVGFAALGLGGVVEDRNARALLWVAPTVATAVWMRSEGVLYSLGLAAGVGVIAAVALHRRRFGDLLLLGGAAATVSAVAVAAYFIDAMLARRISGSSGPIATTSRVLGIGTGPLGHMWASLLRPGSGSTIIWPAAVTATAVLCAAFLHRMVGRRTLPLQVGVLTVACGSSIWMQVGDLSLLTGLIGAFPLLAGGLILLPRFVGDPFRWVLFVGSTVSLVMIVLTGYEEGGASEWGGRFYLPLVVLVIPLAVAGLFGWAKESGRQGRLIVACVAVLALGSGMFQVRLNGQRRAFASSIDRAVAALGAGDDSVGRPLLIVGGIDVGGTSRILWARRSRIDVLAAPTLETTFDLIRFAAVNGHASVHLMISMDDALVQRVASAWLAPLGWRLGPPSQAGVSGFRLYPVGRTTR